MVDYVQSISASTTMMIRDTGGNVEFWIQTGSQTWNNEQPWSYRANGVDSPVLYYRLLRGGFWQKFGEEFIHYDQDVRFSIANSGIGFPSYDFFHHITRVTTPGPPIMQQTYAISSTYIHIEFAAGNSGGSAVLEWQIGYGADSNYPQYYWTSSGTSDVGPFVPGERVYFWTRGRNSTGWGAWSTRTEATTWKVPAAPSPITFSQVKQTSVMTLFADRSDGGNLILERQLGYGLDPDTQESFADVPESGIKLVTGLDPGELHYFWGRSRNSVGWGPWSDRRSVYLASGARVLVGSIWKRAVPYVRHAGVWKIAKPYVKDAGVWKETN